MFIESDASIGALCQEGNVNLSVGHSALNMALAVHKKNGPPDGTEGGRRSHRFL